MREREALCAACEILLVRNKDVYCMRSFVIFFITVDVYCSDAFCAAIVSRVTASSSSGSFCDCRAAANFSSAASVVLGPQRNIFGLCGAQGGVNIMLC